MAEEKIPKEKGKKKKKETQDSPKDTPVKEAPLEELAILETEEKIIEEVDAKEVEMVSADAIKEEELGATIPIVKVDTGKWVPKTEIGRKVKSGEITDIETILQNGKNILEAEIVDILLPNLESDLLLIGQSKGKFGGGQRRVFRQTQKKTREGNKPSFAAFAIVGDKNGHIGYGYGKAKETIPAREKAFRNAKLNIMTIRRGCGSWQCSCGTPHTVPFKITGKCGSVIVTLMPAPKGTGLCTDSEIGKILKIAGVKDVWSKTRGKANTKINHIFATIAALNQLMGTKITQKQKEMLSIVEGNIDINDGVAKSEE